MKKTRKRKVFIILFSIIGVVVISLATVVLTSLYINNPTKGTAIGEYKNPKSALLVIDVQNDTTSNTAYSDTTEFVDNVNQAILFAGANDMEVFYIKNEYGNNPIISILAGGRYKKGTPGAELESRLQIINENMFPKSIGDSFSNKDFEEYLVSKEIDTLYIVGADAAACVYSTAMGGKNRGYNVNIIKNAIITVNDSAMKKMLEQYTSSGIGTIDLTQFEELAQNK